MAGALELGLELFRFEGARLYSVRGFTAATDTTHPNPVAQLWNPSSTRAIAVLSALCFGAGTMPSATRAELQIRRSTARGTAGSTVTPDIDNDWARDLAPPSGALLDLAAFSANPTAAAPELWGCSVGSAAIAGSEANGFGWTFPEGVFVEGGAGLCIWTQTSVATAFPASEVAYTWAEL